MKCQCQNCGRLMTLYVSNQRFCKRECSDEFYQRERREAVSWYRACGMRPQTLQSDEDQTTEAAR
jgi:hypothetical protein